MFGYFTHLCPLGEVVCFHAHHSFRLYNCTRIVRHRLVTIASRLSLGSNPRFRVPLITTTTTTTVATPTRGLQLPFILEYGRSTIYHRIWSPLPRWKDPSLDCRFTCKGEDSRLASSRKVSPMDGCQDYGCVPRRFQKEDYRGCWKAPQ